MKSRVFVVAGALLLMAACKSSATSTKKPLLLSSDELNYSFSLDREIVDVTWSEDGSLSLSYEFTFTNDISGSPIDFVDVYIPSRDYSLEDIKAEVDGNAVLHIAESAVASGAIELGLEEHAIPPGKTGFVSTRIGQIHDVLFLEPEDDRYVNAVFFPSWFGQDFTHGTTDLTVIFRFPPGVQSTEIRWHQSPSDWPEDPIEGVDDLERVTYAWNNQKANGYTQYLFWVSFPKANIPETAVVSLGRLDPLSAIAYYNLRGAGQGAAVIEMDSSDATAYFLRGELYAEAGEQERAISDLERALELGLDPSSRQKAEELLVELRQ